MHSRMLRSSLFMNFFLLFLLCGFSDISIRGNETDRASLIQFKSQVNDPSGALESWNGTAHFCSWSGVTCGTRHRRVVVLDLQLLNLGGSVSAYIGNLSFLREIYLQGNKLSGEIPPEVGLLKRLRELSVHNNSLTGNIPPSLSNCSYLNTLRVSRNQLVGEIPPSIGNMSSLTGFYAARNDLYGGIPSSFGRLKNIQVLGIAVNNFSGTIPPSIFNLSSLVTLDVGYNTFKGTLPSDLFNTLPNLRFFSFVSNFISGSVPMSISNASNLEFFQANQNNLSGAVPSLAKLHRLQSLFMSTNFLGTGRVDDLEFLASLVNATMLQFVYIHQNSFGGLLPTNIGKFPTTLIHLSVQVNQITGEIPSDIGKLVNLEILYMGRNRISGKIPSGIGKLAKLVQLSLGVNELTGEVPSSIGNLKLLNGLDLSVNRFHGTIPANLGMLPQLIRLDLSDNKFSGSIPKEILSISSLSIGLDLSSNELTGSLPVEVGNLKNLGVLLVSNNNLSGYIPSTLGECTRLEELYMRGNHFQGMIPSSLSSLRGLQGLDLSSNNLSGEIPQFLETFNTMLLLNLSYNILEGAVPTDGIFKNTTAALVMGNDKLCGGLPELQLHACILREPKSKHKRGLIAAGIVIPVFLGVSLFALLLFYFLSKKKRRVPCSPSFSSTPKKFLLNTSYHSLVKATDGFSEANLIGVGAFGSVYKGTLLLEEGGDQMVIAVKVLNLIRRGAVKSFLAECEALRNIRHRNLVKVLTACSSVDNNGNNFKALVYEFMANGSLDDWLHKDSGSDSEAPAPRKMSLHQRLNIAHDVACAVDYLHNYCENPIVHCDLKPSNILLDEEMVAHVGDFGLAKFIELEASNQIQASQSSSIGVRGSTGYVAPEYGIGSEVSVEGDVYSYGIILLELLTAKRPTDEMFNESLNLHNFVEKAVVGNLVEITDSALLDELDDKQQGDQTTGYRGRVFAHDQSCKTQQFLVSLFQIGMACSIESPRERMKISDVVAELSSIRDKLIELEGRIV